MITDVICGSAYPCRIYGLLAHMLEPGEVTRYLYSDVYQYVNILKSTKMYSSYVTVVKIDQLRDKNSGNYVNILVCKNV